MARGAAARDTARLRHKQASGRACHLLAEQTTRDQEFGMLERIRDNCPEYVLSLDEVPRDATASST